MLQSGWLQWQKPLLNSRHFLGLQGLTSLVRLRESQEWHITFRRCINLSGMQRPQWMSCKGIWSLATLFHGAKLLFYGGCLRKYQYVGWSEDHFLKIVAGITPPQSMHLHPVQIETRKAQTSNETMKTKREEDRSPCTESTLGRHEGKLQIQEKSNGSHKAYRLYISFSAYVIRLIIWCDYITRFVQRLNRIAAYSAEVIAMSHRYSKRKEKKK